MPNHRQLAALLWLVALLTWALTKPDVRESLGSFLRLLPKVFVPFGILTGWALAEVVLGRWLGLWTTSLFTDTTFWFFGTAAVLLLNIGEVQKSPHYVRRKATEVLGVTVLVETASELFVLPLIAEVALVPFVMVLAGVSVVATRQAEQARVKRVVDQILGLIGFAVVGYVVLRVVSGWHDLDRASAARQLALPIWMTIGVLPIVYLFAVYAGYELVFLRMGWSTNADHKPTLRSRWVAATSFGLRAHDLGTFVGHWPRMLGEVTTVAAGRQVIREFRIERAKEAESEREAADRLIRFEGVDGVDDDGRQLDRREFKETTASLYWLATCQLGWYQRQGDRYRPDLLEAFGDDFSLQGLPAPSGISLVVSGDGQAWYAWRRTASGWCFAIGAGGPPPERWTYDGPHPPTGPPRVDPCWGEEPFEPAADVNWE